MPSSSCMPAADHHVRQRALSPSIEPTPQQFDAPAPGVLPPVVDPETSPACMNEQQPIDIADPKANTGSSYISDGYERQVVTAGIILTIQVQLLTSSSMVITTTTHALLSIGVILELLGILLAICFVHSHHRDPPQRPSMLVRLTSGVPTVLILTGLIGLAMAFVMETLKTSLSTAVVMGGFIISAIFLCILALFCGPWKRVTSHDSRLRGGVSTRVTDVDPRRDVC